MSTCPTWLVVWPQVVWGCRTPVYMSPELITANGKGYDGRSVDIWASGVLLIVMLLGQFPFDHIENPDPNSKDAQDEVWCAPWRSEKDLGFQYTACAARGFIRVVRISPVDFRRGL
jgi:serine/threonine protein kinase